jgi:hypothetical protein
MARDVGELVAVGDVPGQQVGDPADRLVGVGVGDKHGDLATGVELAGAQCGGDARVAAADDDQMHLGGGDELVGELDRQPGGRDRAGDGLGVLGDALDRDVDAGGRGGEDRERAAWVAVLGLADRAAVDEQHAAVVVHPRLVRVPEHQDPVGLGGREPFVQARGLSSKRYSLTLRGEP